MGSFSSEANTGGSTAVKIKADTAAYNSILEYVRIGVIMRKISVQTLLLAVAGVIAVLFSAMVIITLKHTDKEVYDNNNSKVSFEESGKENQYYDGDEYNKNSNDYIDEFTGEYEEPGNEEADTVYQISELIAKPELNDFYNGYAIIEDKEDSDFYIIDQNGDIVNYFDIDGNLIIKTGITASKTFIFNTLFYEPEDIVGIMDLNGKIIYSILREGDSFISFYNTESDTLNISKLVDTFEQTENQFGVINTRGEEVVPLTSEYNYIYCITENIALCIKDADTLYGCYENAVLVKLDENKSIPLTFGRYDMRAHVICNSYPILREGKILMVTTIDGVCGVYAFDENLNYNMLMSVENRGLPSLLPEVGRLSDGLFFIVKRTQCTI